MRKTVFIVLWAMTLAVAGVLLWRTTGTAAAASARDTLPHGAASAPSGGSPAPAPSAKDLFNLSPFEPLPLDVPLDGRKVALGERLFRETRLSEDGTISCASCHDLANGGDDGRKVSKGVGGASGTMNSPTVFNGAYNFRQFWDGRAATLEEQINGPLCHPAEMGSSWPDALAMLGKDAAYSKSFEETYADGITADNLRDAIATFERSLITPNARFDRFLRGEKDVLTADEQEGYRLFTEIGCVTCHQGMNIGGNMFQVLGRMGNYFDDRGDIQPSDLGRFNVTGDERDKYKFKVPSLRNVELTAPYLHDGSAATLEQAVETMARYQIGQPLHPDELEHLVAFLKTLTGESARRP